MNNLDLLIPTTANPDESWTWATITGIGPLRVRLDGDDKPLDVTPDCLIHDPEAGMRVYVQRLGRRTIIHGSPNTAVGTGVQSLHINPDFETTGTDGFADAWSRFWGSSNSMYALDTTTCIAGSRSVRIDVGAGQNGRLHSNSIMSVLPGSLVTIKIWAKGDIAGRRLEIGLLADVGGNPDFYNGTSTLKLWTKTVTLSATWAEYTFTQVIPMGYTVARLTMIPSMSSGESGTFWIDNTTSEMLAQTEDSGWISVSLNPGWSNYGSSWVGARYRKRDGIVYLQGLIAGGTGTIFTLPDGYKPNGRVIVGAMCAGAMARLDITTAGEVIWDGSGNNAWITLANISFPADQ